MQEVLPVQEELKEEVKPKKKKGVVFHDEAPV